MSTGDGQGIAHWSIDVWASGCRRRGEIEEMTKILGSIQSKYNQSTVYDEELLDLKVQGQINYTNNNIMIILISYVF